MSSRYGAAGDRLQRVAWEVSDGYRRPSTRSYDTAITTVGGKGLATDFAAFAAASSEWRAPATGFALPSLLPDVERRGELAVDGPSTSVAMDHLTFAHYDVPATSAGRIRLAATFPAGVYGAVALVGRAGAIGSGQVTTRIAELPAGGTGGVTLDQAQSFIAAGGRVTAVLVNADATQTGWGTDDWLWTRDAQSVSARVITDTGGPRLTARSPGSGAKGVRTSTGVRVTFSKAVSGVRTQTFTLQRPGGRAVPARVSYSSSSRTATLTPTVALSDTTRYTVRLSDTIVDDAATPLAPQRWTFTTVRRGPRVAVSVLSKNRRAVRVALRSADTDRVGWTARLRAGGRAIARSKGTVRPGRSAAVSLPARGRGSVRLVVDLKDPQGNRKRIARSLRLGR